MPDPRDKFPRWLQFSIGLLIIVSTVVVALETMPELLRYEPLFHAIEAVVVLLFTVEYVTCWYLSTDRLRYPFRPMNIIDLLAIAPFYIAVGMNLSFLRTLRLLRMFRLFKLARYSQAIRLLGEAFRRVGPELAMTGFVAAIAVVVAASALYFAEHDAQPEIYSSIPASLWWAVVTLTTVGYGDVYPQTVVGRIIGAFIMFCGIGLVAVPSGLLASAMTEIMAERRERHSAQADTIGEDS
jgi:voltage-gated potassium channel